MIKRRHEQVVETREKMRGGPGTVTIRHLLAGEEVNAKCRLCAELILPPGSGIGEHRHDLEDEIFIIQKGSGVIVEGGTETVVGPGDVVLTGKGSSHAVTNTGNADLVITAIIMPY